MSPFHESAAILESVSPMLTPVPVRTTSSPRRAESVSLVTIASPPETVPGPARLDEDLPEALATVRERFIWDLLHGLFVHRFFVHRLKKFWNGEECRDRSLHPYEGI